jgi:hypothetical protein
LARPGGLDCGSLVRGGASAVWRSAAVVIPLKYDLYAGLVIEEDDPPATAAAIQRALGEG